MPGFSASGQTLLIVCCVCGLIIAIGAPALSADPVSQVSSGNTSTAEQDWLELRALGDHLVSREVAVRNKALAELERRATVDVLQIGLFHRDVVFRTDTTDALARIRDRRAVPYLLRALRMNNFHAANNGGDDEVSVRVNFKRALVRALEACLDRDFGVTDFDDVSQTTRTISEAEKAMRESSR
jgi:hypothetical protein